MSSRYKMVIVVRKDLKLTKGKLISQCCHAALGAYKLSQKENPSILKRWEYDGSAKIVLSANDEGQLKSIHLSARRCSLASVLIQDAGLTVVEPGTITALAIGPSTVPDIDKITGHLKLY